ncbi:MAG: T9SS type A sorting domain-containing protein [Bacteriovoracaceae bacterium]
MVKRVIEYLGLALLSFIVGYGQVFENFNGTTFPPVGWTVYSTGGSTQWSRLTANTRNGSAGTANSTNPSIGISKYFTLSMNASSNVASVTYFIAVSSVTTGTGATMIVQAGSDTTAMTTLRTINLEDGGVFTASNSFIQFVDNIDGSLAMGQTGSVDLRSLNPVYIRWSHQKSSGSAASCRLEDVTVPNAVALSVELKSFTAVVRGKAVQLTWQTATETNNYGFEIERSLPLQGGRSGRGLQWSMVGFVEGHGTTNATQLYSFVDASANEPVSYRLKQIDLDGKFEYSQTVETIVAHTVTQYGMDQNYPNPFNPSTQINYQLVAIGHVSLKVYDMLGREVVSMVNGLRPAGVHVVEFDGSKLPSGMYLAKFSSSGYNKVIKMMLTK